MLQSEKRACNKSKIRGT